MDMPAVLLEQVDAQSMVEQGGHRLAQPVVPLVAPPIDQGPGGIGVGLIRMTDEQRVGLEVAVLDHQALVTQRPGQGMAVVKVRPAPGRRSPATWEAQRSALGFQHRGTQAHGDHIEGPAPEGGDGVKDVGADGLGSVGQVSPPAIAERWPPPPTRNRAR